MELIENLIEIIKIGIDKKPNIFRFNKQYNPKLILEIERELSIFLPNSYKQFLTHYNGGYINIFDDLTNIDEENIKWNSTIIFGIDELASAYAKRSHQNWKFTPKPGNEYPFIPFARTNENETLVFINPLIDGESCVFEAIHDEPWNSWELKFFDFSDFLSVYLDLRGDINFAEIGENTTIEEYLNNYPLAKLLYFT